MFPVKIVDFAADKQPMFVAQNNKQKVTRIINGLTGSDVASNPFLLEEKTFAGLLATDIVESARYGQWLSQHYESLKTHPIENIFMYEACVKNYDSEVLSSFPLLPTKAEPQKPFAEFKLNRQSGAQKSRDLAQFTSASLKLQINDLLEHSLDPKSIKSEETVLEMRSEVKNDQSIWRYLNYILKKKPSIKETVVAKQFLIDWTFEDERDHLSNVCEKYREIDGEPEIEVE